MSTTQTNTATKIKDLQEKQDKLRQEKLKLEFFRTTYQNKMFDLTQRLEEALGTSDWAKAEQVLAKLDLEAQDALQALDEAFAEAGL